MISGYRMDISWALVQREAKYFQSQSRTIDTKDS